MPLIKFLEARQNRRFLFILAQVLALMIIGLDILLGPKIELPVALTFPIAIITWFYGRLKGLLYAIFLQLLIGAYRHWEGDFSYSSIWITGCIRVLVFGLIIYCIDIARQIIQLKREVETLRGLLNICSYCKQIRNSDNVWEPIEQFISNRTEADFSHGICPTCLQKAKAELALEIERASRVW